MTAALPVAPSADLFMVQGRQTEFVDAAGDDCSASIIAGVSDKLACYVDATGTLLCAGDLFDIEYGSNFVTTGLEDVNQVYLLQTVNFANGNGACAVVAGVPTCLGRNNPTGQFGTGSAAALESWTPWTAAVEGVSILASGTTSSFCAIDSDGDGWCAGGPFGVTPSLMSGGPYDRIYMDTSGGVSFAETDVWRSSQGRADCTVGADGLDCDGDTILGRPGHVVDGGFIYGGNASARVVWLEDDGKVYVFEVDDDEVTLTTEIFTDVTSLAMAYHYYTDSICVVTDTGSMRCVGSNNAGKLGTGNTDPLVEETEVLAAGTFDLTCR
jgi:hypothetical protein